MPTVLALMLAIRVFDRSGLTDQERSGAVRTADAILRQADVTATWLDCSAGPAGRRSACAAPLASGEIAIRITPAPADSHPAPTRPLGYSLVDPSAGGGTLATVFSDRVAWLAAAAHARPDTLLGRAVAHEIGHLLLGTNEHSPTGLMRAVWTASDLSHNRREDWLFTPADRNRLLNSRIGNADTRIARTDGAAAPLRHPPASTPAPTPPS